MRSNQRKPAPAESRLQAAKLTESIREFVYIPLEDALMVMRIYHILRSGKNIEIKLDSQGRPKLLQVNKEIVHYADR